MILGVFTELGGVGGVQRVGRHLAAVLTAHAHRAGWPVRLLALNDAAGLRRIQVGGHEIEYEGFGRGRWALAHACWQSAGRDARLLLAGHPNLAPLVSAAKLKSPSARSAVVCHGIEVWRPLGRLRRSALQRADCILAPSRHTAEQVVVQQKIPGRVVRLLPWALDPEFAAALQQTRPERPANFPRGRILLSVTRLAASEGYKGADTVILALPRLAGRVPDVQYVIVGDGDDLPRHRALARAAGVADRVHFLGRLSAQSTDLLACYQHCDVFVLPSKGEGFGLVFLEAMACGKPVVAGAHGGTTDIVEDGVSGHLVPHGDVERLAAVCERLLTDRACCDEVARRGRERVEQRYLFPQFEARLTTILDELIGG